MKHLKNFDNYINEGKTKKFKVSAEDKKHATEILNKWMPMGGFKFPYMVASSVIWGNNDLSEIKKKMVVGYNIPEDDFYELADLPPGVLQNIYDRFQDMANRDAEERHDGYIKQIKENLEKNNLL